MSVSDFNVPQLPLPDGSASGVFGSEGSLPSGVLPGTPGGGGNWMDLGSIFGTQKTAPTYPIPGTPQGGLYSPQDFWNPFANSLRDAEQTAIQFVRWAGIWLLLILILLAGLFALSKSQ